MDKDLGKTSSGMSANVAGLLCYAFVWISGLIFYLTEKENKFVRFHAMQSIIVSVVFSILMLIPFLNIIALVAWLILWIFLMVSAYQGKEVKLPFAGDIAEKNA